MDTREALKKLRLGLKETQQTFANRMKTAITTIARYETSRPPRGRALVQLEKIARENGFEEYANVFRDALNEDLGGDLQSIEVMDVTHALYTFIGRPTSSAITEEMYLWALMVALISDEYRSSADAAKKALRRPLADIRSAKHYQSSYLIVRALRRWGRPEEDIARGFDCSVEDLQKLYPLEKRR